MWISDIVNELDKETLIDFICQYNDYVQNFYDEHDEGSYPCCIAEFYDNEYQLEK